jgi:redox-sensitive bicupin YhaK (pirin superfamily)
MTHAPGKYRQVSRHLRQHAHTQGEVLIRQPISPGDEKFMPCQYLAPVLGRLADKWIPTVLLLDDVEAGDGVKGFGPHPHRGQETITYVLEGRLAHQDSYGNKGFLQAGDVQFMCAGRGESLSDIPIGDGLTRSDDAGIIHDESPVPGYGCNRAIQIWVALPTAHEKSAPSYQDIKQDEMPMVTPVAGVEIRIIAGESFGKSAKQRTKVELLYLDIVMDPDTELSHPIPSNFNSFVHTLEGTASVGGIEGRDHTTFFFEKSGDSVILQNKSNVPARMLLVAGDPLEGQIVHQMGPFVASTDAGISQAINDYRSVSENVPPWIDTS